MQFGPKVHHLGSACELCSDFFSWVNKAISISMDGAGEYLPLLSVDVSDVLLLAHRLGEGHLGLAVLLRKNLMVVEWLSDLEALNHAVHLVVVQVLLESSKGTTVVGSIDSAWGLEWECGSGKIDV